jgi:hypothetical protein
VTVSRRKGDAGKADVLFSRLVRSRGRCERCDIDPTFIAFDTAHIVRRRYSATRCVEDNAWCLCQSCHRLVDEWPHEHAWLVERTIGMDRYKELVAQAQAGTGMNSKLFWRGERERLEARCRELDIPTTWRVA